MIGRILLMNMLFGALGGTDFQPVRRGSWRSSISEYERARRKKREKIAKMSRKRNRH